MAVLEGPPLGDELHVPRVIALNRTRPDRLFRAICLAAGLVTLVVLVLIGFFLLTRAMPVFTGAKLEEA